MPGAFPRSVRGIATIVVVALAGAACGGDAGSSSGGASGRSDGHSPPPIGDPRAALPAPAPTPDGSSAATAVTLAQQVRGGGEGGAAALLAALRLSGIGVRGPNEEMAVDPVRPAQGTMIEAWEIRPLVALAREERPVLIPLGELALLIHSTLPELADAPIEQYFMDGVRGHTTDLESPLAFWANFVNALGGSHPALGEPDLVTAGDPRAVVVNGLQASLLLRRLGTDLLVRAHPSDAHSAFLAPLRWLSPEPLYAAEAPRPCTLTPAEQTIMDLTAFGTGAIIGGVKSGDLGFPGLMEYLGKKGVPGVEAIGKFTSVAGIVLSYAQFLQTYSALEADLAIDQGPLPRTKELRPKTGEQRKLVASIHFTTGDGQAINCFRIMLNSAGLDFTVAQNGPVKGAKVAWTGISGFNQAAAVLHGGPEAIVQFVDDPANRIQSGDNWTFSGGNAVVNQTADDNGTVHIAVEGRGQSKPVPDGAGRVVKEATVGIQVAVKGADLFGDAKDAASTAMAGTAGLTTMPLEILYRMKWATAGTLTFPVLDWGKGKGWSGWVDVTIRGSGHLDNMVATIPLASTRSRYTSVRFDFTNGRGTWTGRETNLLAQSGPLLVACTMQARKTRSVASGSGLALLEVGDEGPDFATLPAEYGQDGDRSSRVDLSYSTEGQSALGVGVVELTGKEMGTFIACGAGASGLIQVIMPYDEEVKITHIPLGSAYGKLPDPSRQTTLRGSLTSPFEEEEYPTEPTIKGTITMRWDLKRTR